MTGMSDEQEKIWLARVAIGDEQAFRALYDSYSPRIYSLGMHLTQSAIMAEELVQDIFEKLWKKRVSLPQVEHFPGYIKAMVRNTASNQLKRMAHERLILQRLAREQPAGEYTTDIAMEQDQFRQFWQESIDSLSPRVKEVYLLSRVEGLKNAEIAEKLGISVYTVKEHLKKALSVIRVHLDNRLDILVVAAMIYFFS
jgi:RNA polymerase sigma-70 factor (family 1)